MGMENRGQDTFSFTYSAKQQDEVRKIRQKYMPVEEDKMEQLRRLDRSVTEKGTAVAIILGVLGALIMGTGMCCVMVWKGGWFIPGIIIGIVGMAVAGIAYPVYQGITRRCREKIAPEILRLTDELMK